METEPVEYASGRHKYDNVWRPDWREDVDFLAAPQKSECRLCGHVMEGTARDLILAFREHRMTVHGQQVKPLRHRAEERLLMLESVTSKVNRDGQLSTHVGRVNSTASNKKNTLVKMVEQRDEFRLQHGRDPVTRDKGFTSGSFKKNVMELFGGWQGFLDYETDEDRAGD